MLYRIEPVEDDNLQEAGVRIAFSEEDVENPGDRKRLRYRLRSLFYAWATITIILGIVLCVVPWLFMVWLSGTGPVWFQRSWPPELVALLDSLPEEAHDDVRESKSTALTISSIQNTSGDLIFRGRGIARKMEGISLLSSWRSVARGLSRGDT